MEMNKQKAAEEKPFYFKQFVLQQKADVMKVGTDGILLGAWVHTAEAKHILDIGTGTGMIAIMCAQKNELAKVDAIDIEKSAYELAVQNAQTCEWKDRLELFHGAIQDFSKVRDVKYDLIVSNPPFFTGGTFSHNNDRNHMRHTIKLPNGELLQSVRRLMNREGLFCVILPYLEGLRFKEQAEQYGFFCTRKTNVRPTPTKEIERLLLEFSLNDSPIQENELIVEDNNQYTDAFVELTKGFYRDMKERE